MLPPVNCVCQPGGIAVPGDLFSVAPSPELGRTSGTQLTGQGKTIWTGLCSVGCYVDDVNWSYSIDHFIMYKNINSLLYT